MFDTNQHLLNYSGKKDYLEYVHDEVDQDDLSILVPKSNSQHANFLIYSLGANLWLSICTELAGLHNQK